jgi:hypothetical protein
MRRNYTGMTTEERNQKLSELQIMLASSEYPSVENCEELQPVIEETQQLEELIRETA